MAFFRELGAAEQKLYVDSYITELSKIYLKAQKELQAKIASINLTDFQRYRTEKLLKETNAIISGLDKQAKEWVADIMPKSYERGVGAAGARLKIMGITDDINFDAQIHTSAVSVLIDDVATDLLIANNSAKKSVNLLIRRTQQKQIEDKAISKMIAEGIVAGEPRVTTSDKILQALLKNAEDGKFITINGRHYNMESYADLLARTRTREANTQGTINRSLQYGNDLVQVSAHAMDEPASDICYQYQGRVFSISGNDPDFPMLDIRPPFHPNCEHVILPVDKETLQSRLGDSGFKNLVDLSTSSAPIKSNNQFNKFLRGTI